MASGPEGFTLSNWYVQNCLAQNCQGIKIQGKLSDIKKYSIPIHVLMIMRALSNQVSCLHGYLLSFWTPRPSCPPHCARQPGVTSAGEVAKIVNVFIIILSSRVFICILFQANAIAENMTAFLKQLKLLTMPYFSIIISSRILLKRIQFRFQFRESLRKLFVIIGNKTKS